MGDDNVVCKHEFQEPGRGQAPDSTNFVTFSAPAPKPSPANRLSVRETPQLQPIATTPPRGTLTRSRESVFSLCLGAVHLGLYLSPNFGGAKLCSRASVHRHVIKDGVGLCEPHVEATSRRRGTMAPSLNELDARLRALREQLGSSRRVASTSLSLRFC